jgi:hypothetical protein
MSFLQELRCKIADPIARLGVREFTAKRFNRLAQGFSPGLAIASNRPVRAAEYIGTAKKRRRFADRNLDRVREQFLS